MHSSAPVEQSAEANLRAVRLPPYLLPLGLLVVAACVLRAAQLAWLADDAFISFRYARNLVDGLGLVYNAGEHVEGYTNLLWTLAIAAGLRIGWAAETFAHALGIGCWLALAAVLGLRAWRSARALGRTPLPLAAALTLLLADLQRWATSGLETSMFSLFATAGLLAIATPRASRRRLLTAGLLLGLTTLTRPDGVIFAALGVGFAPLMRAAASPRQRLSDGLTVALPLLLIGSALVWFKLAYYGELFPTAFYTKSALSHYYSQGLAYVGLFFSRNWFAALSVPLLLWPLRRRLAVLATADNGLFLAAFALFTLYVVHSAGDYMYARRLLPALPFLLLLLESMLGHWPRQHAAALAGAILLAACLPRTLYGPDFTEIRGVVNEWAAYPPSYVARSKVRGELAGKLLGATPVRAIFQGGMCMFAYYSRLPYLVEMTGLTQYSLAKQPLAARGKVGHEKKASEAWLTANDIHLIFFHGDPPLVEDGYRHYELMRLGGQLTAMIWIYSDAVMDPLRGRADVDFVPIEAVLKAAEQDIARANFADARRILANLERYYLDHAAPARAATAARLRKMVADKRELH